MKRQRANERERKRPAGGMFLTEAREREKSGGARVKRRKMDSS